MDAASRSAPAPGRGAAAALVGATGIVIALAVFAGGGSGDGSIPLVGGVAAVVAGVAVIAAFRGALPVPRLDGAGRVLVAGVTALTVWVGLSIVWSIAADHSWAWLNRGLAYLAVLVLGLLVGALRGGVRALAAVLAVVVGAAVAWALLGVVVPSLFADGDRIARLREPVGYWNALALVADVALALGMWLARATVRPVRVGGALLVFGATVALLLTQSRAGILAGVAVVTVVLLLSRRPLEVALATVLAAGPALVVAAWALTRAALVEDAVGREPRVDDGRLFGVLLAAGAAVTVLLALRVRVGPTLERHRRSVVRGLVAAAVAVAALGLGGLVATVGNPVDWAVSQLDGGECANDPGRLTTLCDNNRVAWWGEALEIARAQPAVGTGAGTFAIARLRVRDDATPVAQPHSVPLQLLADTGVVGLGLGLVVLVAAVLVVRGALRQLDGSEREAAVALVAVPLAFGLHSLVDYDLDFVAVAVPLLAVLGALAAAGRPATRVHVGLLPVAVVVLVTAGALVSLASPWLAERAVTDAYVELDRGELTAAAGSARRARQLDPLSLEPVFAQAAVAEAAGDTERARALYEEATRMQPENPGPWLALARFHFASAPPGYCDAYEAFNSAYTLDPMSRRWVPGGPLDVSRDAVNAGACER